MHVTLTPSKEAFIRQAIEGDRFDRVEDPVMEALLSWEEREMRLASFIASLDEADASLDLGEGVPITHDSMSSLAEDIKRRGRARLAAVRQRSG